MIFEIDELDFSRYSPDQLARVRPLIEDVAAITRRNLRLLDSVLGIRKGLPDITHEQESLRRKLHEANSLAIALQNDLDEANSRIAELEVRLADSQDDEHDAIYRSVGLVAHAHKVVVDAARRALLHHHHPDRWPLREKARATASFQIVNAAFDRITEFRR